eukprot:6492079-Amphidinium_carterae.1
MSTEKEELQAPLHSASNYQAAVATENQVARREPKQEFMAESSWDAVAAPVVEDSGDELEFLPHIADTSTSAANESVCPFVSWDEVAALHVTDLEESHDVVVDSSSVVQQLGMCETLINPRVKRRRGRPKKVAEVQASNVVSMESGSGKAASSRSKAGHQQLVIPSFNFHEAPGMLAAEVFVPATARFVPKPIEGCTPLSPNCSTLWHCISYSQQAGAALDDEYLSLQREYVANADHHGTSRVVETETLGVSLNTIQSKLQRLAAGHLCFDRFGRWLLESEFVSALKSTNGLKVYIDAVAYDETQMRSSTKGDTISGVIEQPSSCPSTTDLATMQMLEQSIKTETTNCKVLQIRQWQALLLKVEHLSVQLFGNNISPLQVMERTTAEVLKACLQRVSSVSFSHKDFAMQTRHHCSDKAAYNSKAERGIAAERHGKWVSLGTFCDIHVTSTCHSKTYQTLMADDVQGLCRLSLSLQSASAMSGFRKALRVEIRSRLKVMEGAVDSEARRHKENCMKLFLGGESKNEVLHKMLLARLPNGDWRDGNSVHYIVQPGQLESTNLQEVVQLVESGLLWVMTGCKPKVYPRHRWTGADITIDQLAKVEMVHRLLSHSYRRFVTSFSKPSKLLSRDVVTTTSLNEEQEDLLLEALPEGDMAEDTRDHAPFGVGMLAEQEVEANAARVDDGNKSAAEHSKDRKL